MKVNAHTEKVNAHTEKVNAHTEQPQPSPLSQMEHSPWVLYPTMLVGICSLLAIVWNSMKFLNNINTEIIAIHKELCRHSKEMVKLEEKYQNTYFFLIRQHGIETVQRNFRQGDRLEDQENE